MRVLHPLLSSAAALLLALPQASLGQPDPTSSITRFPHLPSKIFYFDDTTDVLYHDPLLETVHRSENEGKDWKPVEGVPEGEASELIQHPHDNQVAFILTRSKTHYATYNRGSTWQTFTVPAAPTLSGPPMSFHSTEKGWVLYQGTVCEDTGTGKWGSGKSCWDETYYTNTAFRDSPPKLLLSQTTSCLFAHSSKTFLSPNPSQTSSQIFCIAFDPSSSPTSGHSLSESRLYRSKDWFKSKEVVDLGIGRGAKGVVGLGVVSKFLVVALRTDLVKGGEGSGGGGDPMAMYVTTDGINWGIAKFPHSAFPSLKENAYTIVESTTHSLAIDVLVHPQAAIGDLFVSNSNGTEFVLSLRDTNRNSRGIVDYESLVGLDGVGVANIVGNREEVVGWGKPKEIQSRITWDDGRSWSRLKPPSKKANGDDFACDVKSENCSLHVHSVSTPHNFGKVFSSTAPGYVMAVGSVGKFLEPYDDCDTFISTDAGVTWSMSFPDASKYEFGDQGSILVTIGDEEPTDFIKYSFDSGKTWKEYKFGLVLRALLLTTIPDSTSQKFLLLGSVPKREAGSSDRHAAVFLDFAALRTKQCQEKDFERWYARPEGAECLMGHKQWYKRRKLDADCYVGHKFDDPVGEEENCPCSDIDFECDFNFSLQDGQCVLSGPEPVPEGVCIHQDDKYEGSSGYRLIPGDTCDRAKGVKKDATVTKSCSQARPADGKISHQLHNFDAKVVQHAYLGDSKSLLVQLSDNAIWHSSNEGFTWKRLYPEKNFLALAVHSFSKDRAYMITDDGQVYYTTDTGKNWYTFRPPTDPNGLNIPIMAFHPTKADWLIWTGQVDCKEPTSPNCRAVAHYSTDNGRNWRVIDSYVRTCAWARDSKFHKIDERTIICESYAKKEGSQRSQKFNTLELVKGDQYYSKKERLFEQVIGFAVFSEYLVVAEMNDRNGNLNLQVTLDGQHFAEGQFPPGQGIENKYTILESSTDSVFLHLTTSTKDGDEYGTLFKSNSNGTYYGQSIDNVNRNKRGYVDFEKMIGLDGIAVLNVVSNPDEAAVNGRKKLQTRITHNDGGSWKPMTPPSKDSLGQPYACTSTSCALHIHGYTERRDPKATYSSPSAVGLMMAVGNVGEELAGYTDSDLFLTRDAGFTWEEVHKDAHLWEFGDYGSILIIANDEDATDHVLYTTDEGLTWQDYNFGEPLYVKSIQTVPSDTSRKFLLFGTRPKKPDLSVGVHIDFSALTTKKCEQKIEDPNHDDFELWSPSESRDETCLFGRQVLYHRRIRDRNCYVGDTLKRTLSVTQKNCTCTASDFECEFNHHRDSSGRCVLFPSASPLHPLSSQDEQCRTSADGYWYERTAYRRIPYSSCQGGVRPDRGPRHDCPNIYVGDKKGGLFWWTMAVIPFAFAGLMGMWWKKRQEAGPIRLGDRGAFGGTSSGSGPLEILASVPYFLIGATGALFAWVEANWTRLPFVDQFRPRSGYRTVAVDDDAEILRGAYEDD